MGETVIFRGDTATKIQPIRLRVDGRTPQAGLRVESPFCGKSTVIEPVAYERRPGRAYVAVRTDSGVEDGLPNDLLHLVHHKPGIIHPWVLAQRRLWVDVRGHEHLIAEMPTPYLENVIGFLHKRDTARLRWAYALYSALQQDPDEIDYDAANPDLEDPDFIPELPVYRAIQDELAKRDPGRDPAELTLEQLVDLAEDIAIQGALAQVRLRPVATAARDTLREAGFRVD